MAHNFRVIIVGGGVAGLVAAHCLHKAGIDHVVLERGSVAAPAEGASIAIYPHGARILDQISCLEAAKRACVPMDRFYNRAPNGTTLVESGFFHYVKENFGEDILLLERRQYLQLLYDALPDKTAIRFDQKVTDVVEDYEGVTVHLENDEEIHGDMVLGCDGVHSAVRQAMWRNANSLVPGTINACEKTCKLSPGHDKTLQAVVCAHRKAAISTFWSCLIGVGPPNVGMGTRDMTCVHNDGFSFLVLSQPDKVFFFVFFRLNKPAVWPNRLRYTDEDANEAASSVGGYPISPSTLFGELWQARWRGSMVALEEGILEHWFFDRTVLAGDSVHKITPNIALGGNSSMESVVTLVNGLHRMLHEHAGAKPSRATLRRVFTEYQELRKPRMRKIMQYSSLLTRVQAWDNPLLRFAATWVVPYIPDRVIADDLSKRFIATAPKLNFVQSTADFGKDAKWHFTDQPEIGSISASGRMSSWTISPKDGWASGSSLLSSKAWFLSRALSEEKEPFRVVWALLVLFTVFFWLVFGH